MKTKNKNLKHRPKTIKIRQMNNKLKIIKIKPKKNLKNKQQTINHKIKQKVKTNLMHNKLNNKHKNKNIKNKVKALKLIPK